MILNTREKVNPLNWNKIIKRAITAGKGKFDGAKELNLFLDAYENEIKKAIREIRTDNISIESEEIKRKLVEKFSNKSTASFFDALDLFIKVKKNDSTEETLTKFTNLKNHLSEFKKKRFVNLNFGNIDLSFYDSFLNYLIYDKTVKKLNQYLKELCEKAKLFDKVRITEQKGNQSIETE